ncbi:hypothetical protein RFI_21680, partial [Reticulomyxa filosa]
TNFLKTMESPNAKKRTLSEQKESDIDPKKVAEGEAEGELDIIETFKAYIGARGKSEKKEGESLVIEEELDALRAEHPDEEISMDVVLNNANGMVIPDEISEEIEQLISNLNEAFENEEEEEEDDDDVRFARYAKLSKKTFTSLQNVLNEIKSEWEKKNYAAVFSKLLSVTYGGCLQNRWWHELEEEDKPQIEAFFQTLSDLWTQLLTKADKEYCQDNLSTSDKRFINAMMDVLKKQTDAFNWTFQKLKLPNPEPLSWEKVQKEYDIPNIYLKEEVEDSDNQSNSENQGDENEDEGESAEEGGATNENGATEPPTKKAKH